MKQLFNEIDADLRNKLNFPKILLARLLQSDGAVDKKQIRQAVKDLDSAVKLTMRLSVLFSKMSKGKS